MNIYESKHYKLLLIIPAVVLVIAAFFAMQVKFGIDMRGGISIIAPSNAQTTPDALETALNARFDLEELKVRSIGGAVPGFVIEFVGEKTLLNAQTALEKTDYEQAIQVSTSYLQKNNVPEPTVTTASAQEKAQSYYSTAREAFKNKLTTFLSAELGASSDSFSVQDIGPSLGSFFLNQTLTAIAFAFILVVALVFWFFRTPIVSIAVVQAAFYDAILGFAALGFFQIPLTLAMLAPLLMLIGFSVDTDIVLTERMMKRKEGTPTQRLLSASKTGLTMAFSAIASSIRHAIA